MFCNVQHFWAFRIGEHLVYLDNCASVHEGAFNVESLKVEVACIYYLQISDEKRAKGSFLSYTSISFYFFSLHSSLGLKGLVVVVFIELCQVIPLLDVDASFFWYLCPVLFMRNVLIILLSRFVAYHWGTQVLWKGIR
jgi:hypothetical protein